MALYRYRGRNQRGETVTGQVEGASPDAVATQLFNSGVVPVDINAAGSAAKDLGAAISAWFASDKVSLLDLAIFSRQLYTLLKAGVPIMQSLRSLRDSMQNPTLAKVVNDLVDSLDSGLEFSAAMKRHPNVFSNLYVSMVQVGEATGSLDAVLLQLAAYLEHEKVTRDRIKQTTRYPIMVLIAMLAGLLFVSLYVVPSFAKLYTGFKIELPLPTNIIIGVSNFVVGYWGAMLVVTLVGVLGIRYYVATPEGRYKWHKLKLKLPVFGRVIYQSTLERFTRALAIMIRTGVPLVQGMTIVSRAVDNDFVGERVLQMRDGIERGETIARTAVATGMFPPLVIQMINVGEESGALDDLMNNIASHYEREVVYDIDNLSTSIQPILICILGVMVLILALGVFLPMWDLVKLAR